MSVDVSPLMEIERLVQQRARQLSLDTDRQPDALASLVDEMVQAWDVEHKRGIRPFPLPEPERLAERALRNLTGYGPLTPLLADDDVWEIMLNGPSEIFVKRHRGPSGYHDEVFHDDAHVARTITKILENSSSAHRTLDPGEGLQDAQLDDGSRMHIVHGDIARGGHLIVNIRKFSGVAYRDLEQLVATDMLDPLTASFLTACVRAPASIVFAGAPGSGKTTLLSCCTARLDPTLRVVVAEEVFETDVPVPNVASMQTRPSRADRPAVDLRRLVAGFLRMAPDIAVVGEVRDREAMPLLLCLSSGVKGFTTLHAGSARQALTRLRFIAQLADHALPMSALNSLVSEAVDVVVHCARTADGPKVMEILAVEDLAGGPDAAQFTTTPIFERAAPTEPLRWTGQVPVRLEQLIRRAGGELLPVLGAEASV